MSEKPRGPARFTWPQLVALLVGAFYFLLGLLGFFFLGDVEGSLANHDSQDTMLGLELNALQNVVHLVLGILGMAAASRLSTARSYGAVLAVIGFALFVYGAIAVSNRDINVLSLNWPDNILHLVTALVGLAMAVGPIRRSERERSRAGER
jgi:hypothetical protein